MEGWCSVWQIQLLLEIHLWISPLHLAIPERGYNRTTIWPVHLLKLCLPLGQEKNPVCLLVKANSGQCNRLPVKYWIYYYNFNWYYGTYTVEITIHQNIRVFKSTSLQNCSSCLKVVDSELFLLLAWRSKAEFRANLEWVQTNFRAIAEPFQIVEKKCLMKRPNCFLAGKNIFLNRSLRTYLWHWLWK